MALKLWLTCCQECHRLNWQRKIASLFGVAYNQLLVTWKILRATVRYVLNYYAPERINPKLLIRLAMFVLDLVKAKLSRSSTYQDIQWKVYNHYSSSAERASLAMNLKSVIQQMEACVKTEYCCTREGGINIYRSESWTFLAWLTEVYQLIFGLIELMREMCFACAFRCRNKGHILYIVDMTRILITSFYNGGQDWLHLKRTNLGNRLRKSEK